MYDKLVLPNGLRIVSEPMVNVRSAAVGIFVGVGSRDEKTEENGAAHFIEHMLFKGTERHTAQELASVMDSIGGQINAYTTRENTCFYARVLDEHLHTAIDVLADMFKNSRFDENEVMSERSVIQDEIDMYDDTPEDLVIERLFARVFKGSLGRPVLGKPSTLAKMSGEKLREFKERHYTPDRIVVSLCGSFEQSHLDAIAEAFGTIGGHGGKSAPRGEYSPVIITRKRALEQNHLVLGFPGLTHSDDERYTLQLMSSILGGGMSSRLFQTVREKHGLCYSVYSFSAAFRDTGMFGIATALGRETEPRALGLIMEEIRGLLDNGVSGEELSRAREQVKSSIVMSLESSSSRMQKLGGGELALGESPDPGELIDRYNRVSENDVLQLARRILDFDRMSVSAVGRVGKAEEYQQLL